MSIARQFEDAWTSNLKEDVVRKAITSLERMDGDSLLSGDESGLIKADDAIRRTDGLN